MSRVLQIMTASWNLILIYMWRINKHVKNKWNCSYLLSAVVRILFYFQMLLMKMNVAINTCPWKVNETYKATKVLLWCDFRRWRFPLNWPHKTGITQASHWPACSKQSEELVNHSRLIPYPTVLPACQQHHNSPESKKSAERSRAHVENVKLSFQ